MFLFLQEVALFSVGCIQLLLDDVCYVLLANYQCFCFCRKLPCSVLDVFNFCWTMFVQVKGKSDLQINVLN